MRTKNNDLKEAIRNYFEAYSEQKGFAPTVREVSAAFSITVNKAYRYLSDLQSEGVIAKERGFVSKKLANKNENVFIEILNQGKYVSFPKTILPNSEYAFIEENGSFYLIDIKKTAKIGDIVAAKNSNNIALGILTSTDVIRYGNGIEVNIEQIIGVAVKELKNI